VRERKVKVLAFRTTETREKINIIILAFKKSRNPLLAKKGERRERDL